MAPTVVEASAFHPSFAGGRSGAEVNNKDRNIDA
jgi:hypothetical protein